MRRAAMPRAFAGRCGAAASVIAALCAPLRTAVLHRAAPRMLAVWSLLLILIAPLHAQRPYAALTDEQFVSLVESRRKDPGLRVEGVEPDGKCGLALSFEAMRRQPSLREDLALRLGKAMQFTPMQTYVMSTSGRFRIHFDTSGVNTPAMISGGARVAGTARQYAAEVAQFFDDTYEIEVRQRGYDPPPFDAGQTWYDVRLVEFYRNLYGQTNPNVVVPSGTARTCYTTYIDMDNDFLGYASAGLDGAKVTAAHEFHHMIQLGRYGFWESDQFFYEMTSTYFEDVVFNDVNDYVYYLPKFFRATDKPMYQWAGYETVLWLKMLDKVYGPDIVRRFWEEVRKQAPLPAMETVLRLPAYQTDLATEFCRHARWNWYTGSRTWTAPEAERYDEAATYPKVSMVNSLELTGESAAMNGDVAPLSAHYMQVWRGADTAAFVVGCVDLISAVNKLSNTTGYTVTVRSSALAGWSPLTNGWVFRYTPVNSAFLCMSSFSTTAIEDKALAPFPNPYDPARDGILRVPVKASAPETTAGLYIHSISGSLVHAEGRLAIRSEVQYGRFVTWDGTGGDGAYVQSGVYFYTLDLGGETLTGKIAVIRR